VALTRQDRRLVPITVLEAQPLSKLRAEGPAPIVRGEPGPEQTLALDYRCPSCSQVLVGDIDPKIHRLGIHDVALRCACGQYSMLPNELW
jgi:hypothetical protein